MIKLPERAGIIKLNQSRRYEIQTTSGWTDELSCGTGVSVFINGQWLDTSVEHSDSKGGYYFTTLGLELAEGLTAVLTRYKKD